MAVAADLAAEVPVAAGDEIPGWLRGFLKPQDLLKIRDKVAQVEKETSAEIIPMVVQRSSAIGHVPFLIGLMIFSCVLWLEIHYLWQSHAEWAVLLTAFLMLASFVIGRLLSASTWLQRVLTPNADEAHSVAVRAELEFYRRVFGKTERRAAILIFVSVMEHRVVILADEAISKALPGNTWDTLVAHLVEKLRDGQFQEGLMTSIQECGDLLKGLFPPDGRKTNEIANDLIIKS